MFFGFLLIFLFNYIDLQGFKRFLRITWEPFEEQFQSIETRFIHHTYIVVRSANVDHLIYYYKKETQDKQRQEGECYGYTVRVKLTLRYLDEKLNERRRKILEWLSPNSFEEIHESNFGKRFQGTGQWLLDDSRFISWRDKAQSALLWCHGARTLHLQPILMAVVDLFI